MPYIWLKIGFKVIFRAKMPIEGNFPRLKIQILGFQSHFLAFYRIQECFNGSFLHV